MTAYGNATVAGVDCHPQPPTDPPCINMPFLAPSTPQCSQGAVRLTGGNSSFGRVEVCFNASWTPLCQLNETVASVICRTLGYSLYSCKLLFILVFITILLLLLVFLSFFAYFFLGAAIFTNHSFGILTNYSYISDINCDPAATDLSTCSLYTEDCIPNCPNANLALSCFSE